MVGAALALVLTAHQVMALNQACEAGDKYGLCKTFMAVVLVESSACVARRGDDGNSLGCSQLMVQTARDTCQCNINPRVLETDNRLNMEIGAHFLANCYARFYPDTARSEYCFNRGIPAASQASDSEVKHSKYVAKVKAFLRQLQQIPVDTK